jgi:hypothetical protein
MKTKKRKYYNPLEKLVCETIVGLSVAFLMWLVFSYIDVVTGCTLSSFNLFNLLF